MGDILEKYCKKLEKEKEELFEDNRKVKAELWLYKDNDEYLNNEIERLHSIIKEVREYIEKHKIMTQGSFNGKEWEEQYFELTCEPKELLEILDRDSDKE